MSNIFIFLIIFIGLPQLIIQIGFWTDHKGSRGTIGEYLLITFLCLIPIVGLVIALGYGCFLLEENYQFSSKLNKFLKKEL